jgi:hypothetical protein
MPAAPWSIRLTELSSFAAFECATLRNHQVLEQSEYRYEDDNRDLFGDECSLLQLLTDEEIRQPPAKSAFGQVRDAELILLKTPVSQALHW